MALRAIHDIAAALPATVVTNKDLGRQHPDWNMAEIAEKTGVYERRIANESETALDLAEEASKSILLRNALIPDAIIFVTQTPDLGMPSNGFLLQARLGVSRESVVFDINLACSGFVYGLAIASSLVESRLCSRVLLVTADTYSRIVSPGDRSARPLFGDGAAAALVSTSATSSSSDHTSRESSLGRGLEMIDFDLISAGDQWERFVQVGAGMIAGNVGASLSPDPADPYLRRGEHIRMDGMGVWSFVASEVPTQILRLLKRNHLLASEVKTYYFHQASSLALKTLQSRLGIDEAQVPTNIDNVGNTVSASIPILMESVEATRGHMPGDLVVACGFGVGLSSGAVLLRKV